MENRELLEAAARAGAPEAPRHTQGWRYSKAGPFREGMYAAADRTRHWFWNPLSKDGDALRLAVKLHLGIEVYGETPNYHTGVTLVETPDYQSDFVEPHNGDPYAATRLAIVRAAAAIDAQRRET